MSNPIVQNASTGQLSEIRLMLGEIKAGIAGLPTKDMVRGWGITIIIAVFGSMIAVGGLFLAASGNQLSAFQAGMSMIQTSIAVNTPLKPQ